MKNKHPKRFFKIFSSSLAITALASLSLAHSLRAHESSSSDQISIPLAPVGDFDNEPDVNGLGSVSGIFYIGQTDITAHQYCAFLNAVAAEDTYGLYDLRMGELSVGIPALISRHGTPGHYTYVVIGDRGNYPIIYVNYFNAQRFCNWLSNGQPSGYQVPGTTETGSYSMNNQTLVPASTGAIWRLPTEDEWYKVAYYKGGSADAGYWKYPTQSDTAPNIDPNGNNDANYGQWNGKWALSPVGSFVNSPGAYGTFDMGGDVSQWIESEADGSSSKVVIRGGDWHYGSGIYGRYPANELLSSYSDARYPDFKSDAIGFRVVGPDPSAAPSSTASTGTESSEVPSVDASIWDSYVPDISDHVSLNNLTPDEQIAATAVGSVAAVAGAVYGAAAYAGVALLDAPAACWTALSTGASSAYTATIDAFTTCWDGMTSRLAAIRGVTTQSVATAESGAESGAEAVMVETRAVNTKDAFIKNPDYNPTSWFNKGPEFIKNPHYIQEQTI
ncbi:MAG: formylglycine-generating enzyme family protein [Chthoniobacterales bacterium]